MHADQYPVFCVSQTLQEMLIFFVTSLREFHLQRSEIICIMLFISTSLTVQETKYLQFLRKGQQPAISEARDNILIFLFMTMVLKITTVLQSAAVNAL